MPALLHYFAYGSNLHPPRLRARTPSCQVLSVAMLPGYALHFHKRGRDGSGKCNILYTGKAADCVYGVVYQLLAAHKSRLDRAEGLGQGYRLRRLRVLAATREYHAFCYQAEPAYIDDTLQPFAWYQDLVLTGARYHRLPFAYRGRLARITAIPDPDPARHAQHRRLLRMPASQGWNNSAVTGIIAGAIKP